MTNFVFEIRSKLINIGSGDSKCIPVFSIMLSGIAKVFSGAITVSFHAFTRLFVSEKGLAKRNGVLFFFQDEICRPLDLDHVIYDRDNWSVTCWK